MINPIERLFATAGRPLHATEAGKSCPSDEAFAGYLGALLPAHERESLELHSLACSDCHDLLRMVIDLPTMEPALAAMPARSIATEPVRAAVRANSPLRIIGKFAHRVIELLNADELAWVVPQPCPAIRGQAAAELLTVKGPGGGIDEIELHLQADGTAEVFVRCEQMPALAAGEIVSISLDVDGATREKRPFTGDEMRFAPISRGTYRVRLTARAPGGPVRSLAEATLDFSA